MSPPLLDAKRAILEAVAGVSGVVEQLAIWQSGPAIFTRRPVPDDATFPMILIEQVTRDNARDGIDQYRPEVSIDVIVYGRQPNDYRPVENIAERLHQFFHDSRDAVEVANYDLTDIRCTGPFPAPTDDDNEVARAVSLTMRLSALRD